MDQICQKRVFPIKNRKSEHHDWILHIRIIVRTKFQLKLIILIFRTKFALKGYFHSKTKKWTASLNSAYSNSARCRISRCYGTSKPIKRGLTTRPCGTFLNENGMALQGQVRESWPSMAPLGHVDLTKTLWHF